MWFSKNYNFSTNSDFINAMLYEGSFKKIKLQSNIRIVLEEKKCSAIFGQFKKNSKNRNAIKKLINILM